MRSWIPSGIHFEDYMHRARAYYREVIQADQKRERVSLGRVWQWKQLLKTGFVACVEWRQMGKFEFVLKNDTALNRLADITGRKKNEVIKDALSLYQYVVRKRQENNLLYVGPNKKDLTEVDHTSLRGLKSLAASADLTKGP